ncbi:MAG: hypothetical protein H0T73_18755, partial [Ardenticatenales bacterium]|nr:hypothetical protein [Ardenticatenales bacterium]
GDYLWTMLQTGQLLALEVTTGKVIARAAGVELDLNSASHLQQPVLVGEYLLVPIDFLILGFKMEEQP